MSILLFEKEFLICQLTTPNNLKKIKYTWLLRLGTGSKPGTGIFLKFTHHLQLDKSR